MHVDHVIWCVSLPSWSRADTAPLSAAAAAQTRGRSWLEFDALTEPRDVRSLAQSTLDALANAWPVWITVIQLMPRGGVALVATSRPVAGSACADDPSAQHLARTGTSWPW